MLNNKNIKVQAQLPLVGFLLIIFSLFSFHIAGNAAELVGTTPGTFEVTPTGQATYTIPIQVPPGIAGMEPELSLAYNSQGGEGDLGIGWSITGLSAISRCQATYEQDSYRGSIKFDVDDRFCLDGQRLLLVSSNNADRDEFRTEIDSFSRIYSYYSSGNMHDPDYFVVQKKSGLTYFYGNSPVSRIEAQGQTAALSWVVNRIEDTLGNYIRFNYYEDNTIGESHIENIEYTGHSLSEPTRSIIFRYEPLPVEQWRVNRINESKITRRKRLMTIETYISSAVSANQDNLVRRYFLTYKPLTTITQAQKLNRVQECVKATCLLPTSFEWQEGSNGWDPNASRTVPINVSMANNPSFNTPDLDGDGFADLCYRNPTSGIACTLSKPNLFGKGDPVRTPTNLCADGDIANDCNDDNNHSTINFIDVNGDTLTDLVYRGDKGLQILLLKREAPDAFTFAAPDSHRSTNICNDLTACDRTSIKFPDLNGDGLIDICYRDHGDGEGMTCATQQQPPIPSIWGALQVAGPNSGLDICSDGDSACDNGDNHQTIQFVDVDADGKSDLTYRSDYGVYTWLSKGDGNFTGWQQSDICRTAGVSYYEDTGCNNDNDDNYSTIQYPDINGDGYADLCYRSDLHGIVCFFNSGSAAPSSWDGVSGRWVSRRWVDRVNTGICKNNNSDFGSCGNTENFRTIQYADANRDGKADLFVRTDEFGIVIFLSNGRGFDTSNIIKTNICHGQQVYGACDTADLYTSLRLADIDGDGKLDINVLTTNGAAVIPANYGFPDFINKIIDGYGASIGILYSPLTDSSIYTKGDETIEHAVEVDFQGAMYVVKDYSVTNGRKTNGSQEVNTYEYKYYGAKINRLGRGFLGFTGVTITGPDGIQTTTTYHTTFPFTGLPARVTARQASTGIVISDVVNTWGIRKTTGNIAFLPHIQRSSETKYDIDTPSNSILSVVETEHFDIDDFGNIGTIVVTTRHESNVYKKTTTNIYAPADIDNWILGRLTEAVVESAVPNNGGNVHTEIRVSRFEYFPAGDYRQGLLKSEIVEPGDAKLETVTTYDYDEYGNKTKVTLVGREDDPTTAATQIAPRISITQYTADGYFPLYVTRRVNSKDQTETYSYDARFGVPISLVGPNQLTTTWQYDELGRKKREDRADGTFTSWEYTYCNPSCPAPHVTSGIYQIKTTEPGKSSVTVTYDMLGREIMTESFNLNNEIVRKLALFNSLGKIQGTTGIYIKDKETPHWICFTYDIFGRPVVETLPTPISEAQLADQEACRNLAGIRETATYQYSGFATVMNKYKIDRNGSVSVQSTIQSKNAIGQLLQVTDNLNNKIHYGYDANGNLIYTAFQESGKAIDPSLTIRATYDKLGRKTSMDDPDMGHWEYRYNATGELVWQKDAKGQVITMAYDELGRIISRNEPDDGLTTWTYDNPNKGIGKVDTIENRITLYKRKYNYDSLGRVSRVSTEILGTPYNIETTYDSFSRVNTVVYPEIGPGANRFTIKNVYDSFGNGYLSKIQNASTGTVYWQALAMNGAGQVTQELLGNGVTTQRTYDPQFRRLVGINTNKGTTIHQNLTYVFDTLGNLEERKDQRATPLIEAFTYDALNRLKTSTFNGVIKQYQYDYKGNLIYKTGVGHLIYDRSNGAGPHAVSKVSYQDPSQSVTSAGAGDVDGDGLITAADYRLLADFILQGGMGAPAAADCHGDTSINSLDLVCMAKKLRDSGNRFDDRYITSYHYDANGNMIQGAGRIIAYTSYNMPRSIESGNVYSTFQYNDEHQRVVQTSSHGTTVYLDPTGTGQKYYEKEYRDGVVYHKHYIGGLLAVYEVEEKGGTSIAKTRYFHTDHLGSIDVVSDETGAVLERLSFDPFGNRRLASWQDSAGATGSIYTHHGYTGHEHLDELNLVHMNGRIYDPVLGRFLSADPNVQAVANLQSFNRYSYVLNNPLSYTDPSGYFFKELRNFVKQYWRPILAIAIAAIPGVNVMAAGFIGGLITSGGDLRAGLIGAFTAGAFSAVGTAFSGVQGFSVGRMVAHGIVGGVSSRLQGGSFKSGLLSGVATNAFGAIGEGTGLISNTATTWNARAGQAFVAAAIGGTASVIGGGKFANGAVTGAFSRLFNDLNHPNQEDSLRERLGKELQESINEAYKMGQNIEILDYMANVESGGAWDFKSRAEYKDLPGIEDFGNFAFGATAAAWVDGATRGISTWFPNVTANFALRGAGWYQQYRQSYDPKNGTFKDWLSPATSNYGDQFRDSVNVQWGVEWYHHRKY